MIPIPRQALADLLQAAGSPLTPEAYLATLSPSEGFEKYPSRAKVALWSKHILLAAAIISGVWICLPFGFDLSGLLVAIALAVLTFFEYRVHAYFCARNPKAPRLGFRNQTGLAVTIFIYGIYHAMLPFQVPTWLDSFIDPTSLALMKTVIRYGYIAIAVVGGISQFGQAWFYWKARGTASTVEGK